MGKSVACNSVQVCSDNRIFAKPHLMHTKIKYSSFHSMKCQELISINRHSHCCLSQHRFNAACHQIKVEVTTARPLAPDEDTTSLFELECVRSNRTSLTETPPSGNPLASLWIPKSDQWNVSLLPSQTISCLKLQFLCMLNMKMPENRPLSFPW